MTRRIAFLIICLLCCAGIATAAEKHKYTLVIDAGHGGKDAGCEAFHA